MKCYISYMKNLTEEMLQTPRTPTQLHSWVHDTIERIGSTPEGKSAIRLRKGLTKPLIEEVLPLGIFAINHFASASKVTITPVLGSQNYDAIVQGDEDHIIHIEVTQAHEGENDYLRMLELERKGRVSATGTVSKEGTKRTEIKVTVEDKARLAKDIRAEELERIREATIKKSKKDYPEKTALVVMFSDYLHIKETEDVAELKDLIEKKLLQSLKQFILVAFVGSNGHTYLEYQPG